VHHVGQAVVMVVASDRYLAEDVCGRITVTYDPLPPVVGIRTARDGRDLVHPDAPATSPPTWCRRSATSPAAIAARRTCSSSSWRSSAAPACRWRAAASTPAGRRRGPAALLDLHPDDDRRAGRGGGQARAAAEQVDCIAPDVGGGFGVKIMHPWPEEVLSRGRPAGWTAS
jgi:CO/xanthine dehydrogenase Mo-binding subunit